MYTPKLHFVAWQVKKIVQMLTTKYVPEVIDSVKKNHQTGKANTKSNIVISYNTYIGRVDLLNYSSTTYRITRDS